MSAESPAAGSYCSGIGQLLSQDIGVDVFKVEGNNTDTVINVFIVAIDDHLVKLLQPFNESAVKNLFVFGNGIKSHFLQNSHRFSHADNTGIVR